MIYLDALMLILLCSAVVVQYRRSGVLLTPGTAWLISSIAVPVYLGYLFATDPDSLGMIGQQIHAIGMQEAADELLIVVSVAVVCAILAYQLTPTILPQLHRRFAAASIKRLSNVAEMTTGACVSALAGVALVWIFFYSVGEIPMLTSNPDYARSEMVMTHPWRFMYTAGFSMAAVGEIYLLAGLALKTIRAYRTLAWGVVILVAGTNFLTATRGNFLAPFVQAGLIYFSLRPKKLTGTRFFLITGTVSLIAAGLQFLRTKGAYSWGNLTYEIFHGNTIFAAFRDTSWVLMDFERLRYPLFYGKTILAGWLGFLPRSIFPFREQYGWGRVTLEVVHNTDPLHFGLAHVYFGDWYINFGYAGVVLEGLLLGSILRLLDSRLFYMLSQDKRIGEGYKLNIVFKVWFAAAMLGFVFSSALSVLMYPYMVGYFLMLAVAVGVRTVFGRDRPPEEFLAGEGWRSGGTVVPTASRAFRG